MSNYMRLRGPAAEDMPYGATGRPHCQIEDFGPVTEAETVTQRPRARLRGRRMGSSSGLRRVVVAWMPLGGCPPASSHPTPPQVCWTVATALPFLKVGER